MQTSMETANMTTTFKIMCIAIGMLAINSCNISNPIIPNEKSSGKLVFVMVDSTRGPGGIYTMNVDGTGLTPLAVTGDTIYFPGPWGEKYILGKTTNPSMVSHPQWSPDGKKIVCDLMWAFEGYVIMIMNADGTDKHVLWKVRTSAQRPQWSPAGNKILFTRHGYLGIAYATGIVDSNGENDRDFQIAGNTDPYIFNRDSLWFVGDIQWGVNNNLIYILASINKKPVSNPDGTNNTKDLDIEIFSIDEQTGFVLKKITQNDFQEWFFKLSPDGKTVVFPSNNLSYSFNLLSLSNNKLTQILTGGKIDFFFNWSNNSKTIVYARDENTSADPGQGDFHIYIVDIERPTENRKLTQFKATQPSLFIPTQ